MTSLYQEKLHQTISKSCSNSEKISKIATLLFSTNLKVITNQASEIGKFTVSCNSGKIIKLLVKALAVVRQEQTYVQLGGRLFHSFPTWYLPF